jgi:GntP family gluconate:H+ symporter
VSRWPPGVSVAKIVPQMETGMGNGLAHAAPIAGLGAMLGKLLEVSGGLRRSPDRLLRLFGAMQAPLALGLTGLIFGSLCPSMWASLCSRRW